MYIFMKGYSSFLPTFIGLSFYYWFVGVFYICAFIKYNMNISSQSGFRFSSSQLLSYVWLFATPWAAADSIPCGSPLPTLQIDPVLPGERK